MIKSKHDLNNQIQFLLDCHTELEDFTVLPINSLNEKFGFNELARFINQTWKQTYEKQERFKYCPGYLKWVFGAQGFSDYSMAVFNKNELAGVFLHTPRKIILSSRQMQTGIQSALSIQPEHKGKGLAKYLHLKTQEALQKGSLDGQVLWYDCTVKTKHKSSHDIFQNLEGAYL